MAGSKSQEVVPIQQIPTNMWVFLMCVKIVYPQMPWFIDVYRQCPMAKQFHFDS